MLQQESRLQRGFTGQWLNVGGATDLFPGGECGLWPALATPFSRFRGFLAAPAQRGGPGVRMVGQRAKATEAACYSIHPMSFYLLFFDVFSEVAGLSMCCRVTKLWIKTVNIISHS